MVRVVCLRYDDDIPEIDHVIRYCKLPSVDSEEIASSAFAFRPNEKYFSVSWLEYFNGNMTFAQRLQAVRDTIELKLTSTGRLVKIPVGKAKEEIRGMRVKYMPTEKNCAHAGIFLAADDDDNNAQVLELGNFADSCERFPAKID